MQNATIKTAVSKPSIYTLLADYQYRNCNLVQT